MIQLVAREVWDKGGTYRLILYEAQLQLMEVRALDDDDVADVGIDLGIRLS